MRSRLSKLSNLPPGCSERDIDRAAGEPECPTCGHQPTDEELDSECPRCLYRMEKASISRQLENLQ